MFTNSEVTTEINYYNWKIIQQNNIYEVHPKLGKLRLWVGQGTKYSRDT